MKKFISSFLFFMCVILLAACANKTGSNNSSIKSKSETITVAYQPSIGYAPLVVMMEKGMIESHYNGELTVNWKLMKNGAEINEGLVSGAIDVGSMGVNVAITGIMAGSPYKIASALSAQPYALLTNQADINSLEDITSEDQIAIVNINSYPHMLIEMACKEIFGDAHTLDGNMVVLSNADGYSSIISGAVNCHMVISPFNFMELRSEDASIHEVKVPDDIWPAENTAILTVVRNNMKENEDLYKAFMDSMGEAMTFIDENPKETAEILAKSYDASVDEILRWMSDPRSSYSQELHGVMNVANFMVEEGILEKGPSSLSDIAYENVKGN